MSGMRVGTHLFCKMFSNSASLTSDSLLPTPLTSTSIDASAFSSRATPRLPPPSRHHHGLLIAAAADGAAFAEAVSSSSP